MCVCVCGPNRICSTRDKKQGFSSEVWSSSAVAGQWVMERGKEDINRACNSVRAGAFHSGGG